MVLRGAIGARPQAPSDPWPPRGSQKPGLNLWTAPGKKNCQGQDGVEVVRERTE